MANHSLPVAANLVNQKFTATSPNQIRLTDITYIRTREGWLYLAAHKGLFNGEIVDYALDERMTSALVVKSLFRQEAIRDILQQAKTVKAVRVFVSSSLREKILRKKAPHSLF